jgi:small conductance mechanosensitive channel
MKRLRETMGCWLVLLAVWPVVAQQTPNSSLKSHDSPSNAEPQPISEAERINGIRRLHQSDQQRLAGLREALEHSQSSFNTASATFSRIDAQRTVALSHATPSETQSDDNAALWKALEAEWLKARDEFDRVIKRRKAIQQQIDILEEKLRVEQTALDRATNVAPDEAGSDEKAAGKTETPASSAPSEKQNAALSETPAASAATASGTAAKTPELLKNTENNIVADDRVSEAYRQLKLKQAALREAQEKLKLRDHAIDVFERDLTNTRELLEIAQEDLRAAQADWNAVQSQTDSAEPSEETSDDENAVAGKQKDVQRRLEEAKQEVTQEAARVTESERLLQVLKSGRADLVEQVEDAQAAVDAAQLHVQFLESPVAPHRLLNWIIRSGPRIAIVIVAMFAAWWLSRVMARRIVAAVVRRGFWGHPSEREGRAETLRRVFQSTASVAIFILGGLALLDQAGINVTVLLGGAAVLGAAIAFGSQNLIRDYFSGFMVLVENQYSVGNVIRIGGVAGVVEDITLRMTVLRDEEGVVHFIPHSQLTTVSNLTHGWSRAVFTVAVGYNENVDRVMQVLMDLAKELKADPQYSSQILGDAEMLGVDGLTDSAVMIKFLIKTRPLMQWNVKREMLRRIKAKFDALGIEIPYPTRTINVRNFDAHTETHDGATMRLERNGR